MNNASKFTALILLALIAVGGLFLPLQATNDAPVGSLPTFNKSQVTSPVGYGIVTSNGISTTTLTATPNPSMASLTATSTTATSTFSGNVLASKISATNLSLWSSISLPSLTATSTATSTYTGGIDAARVCLTGTTNCLGASGAAVSGTTVDYITATSSNSQGNTGYAAASTTTTTSGHRLNIRAGCVPQNYNGNIALEVKNSGGGGTTTLDWTNVHTSTTQYQTEWLEGVYTPTASGNLFMAIDQDIGGVIFGGASGTFCRSIKFVATQLSN